MHAHPHPGVSLWGIKVQTWLIVVSRMLASCLLWLLENRLKPRWSHTSCNSDSDSVCLKPRWCVHAVQMASRRPWQPFSCCHSCNWSKKVSSSELNSESWALEGIVGPVDDGPQALTLCWVSLAEQWLAFYWLNRIGHSLSPDAFFKYLHLE